MNAVIGIATDTITRLVRLGDINRINPTIVAAYVEQRGQTHAKPSVKQELAAVRMLFDWLVVGQVVPTNPAHSVRGPKHVVKRGKTPVLTREETRELLDCIDTDTVGGLRDRALIGVLVFRFARIGAALTLKVDLPSEARGAKVGDYFAEGSGRSGGQWPVVSGRRPSDHCSLTTVH